MANSYSTYLVHFNRNHDKLGQFTYGDGDADGVTNDHKNQKKKNHNPVKYPYSYSSAALPAKKTKLSKSSILKPSDFSYYKNEDGKVDNKAYTASGAKKLVAGLGGVAVGKLLQSSDNLIVQGAGYVTEYAGWFGVGYGGAQVLIGTANMAYNKKNSK